MTPLTQAISTDHALAVLADLTRRALLRELADSEEPLPIPILARQLAAADTVPARSQEAVETALHHVHLPKLADCGAIELDPRTGTVRYCPTAPLEAILEVLPDDPA